MSATGVNCRRYRGASPCSARKVCTATLYRILSGTRSQWRRTRCNIV